jgi:hypothetical protein
MTKRLQIILNEDAWNAVDALMKEVNEDFNVGNVTYSDVINEMVINSKVDVKALQIKHTDLRRSLRVMASKEELDLDGVIKSLMELKARGGRRVAKAMLAIEEVTE